MAVGSMMLIASALLVGALPFLLWPLLRPDVGAAAPPAGRLEREAVLRAMEEVQLDEASGRLNAAEAGRRLEELRQEAEAAPSPR